MLCCLLDNAANISVSPPTLPKNISPIKTILDTVPRAGVIPRVSPTVPIADADSNRQSASGRFSTPLIIRPPVRNS